MCQSYIRSACGSFIATRSDEQANTVWIWDALALALKAAIVCQRKVTALRWHPTQLCRAFASGTGAVQLWTPSHGPGLTVLEGMRTIPVPAAGFLTRGLRWSVDGASLLLLSREHLTCVHLGLGAAASPAVKAEATEVIQSARKLMRDAGPTDKHALTPPSQYVVRARRQTPGAEADAAPPVPPVAGEGENNADGANAASASQAGKHAERAAVLEEFAAIKVDLQEQQQQLSRQLF